MAYPISEQRLENAPGRPSPEVPGNAGFFVDTPADVVDSKRRSNAGYKWVKGRWFLRIGRFRSADSPAGRTQGIASGRLGLSGSRHSGAGPSSVLFFAMTVVIALFPSCSKPTPTEDDSGSAAGRSSLEKAVERFWDARVEEDYELIYDSLLSRDSARRYPSRDLFLRSKGGIRYHWFDIEKIEVEGDRGRSTVKAAWNHRFEDSVPESVRRAADREPIEETFEQKWTLEDGHWKVTLGLSANPVD